MKNIIIKIQFILLLFMAINANGQINGFTLTTPTTSNTIGDQFPVNASFNWTNTTTSATITINYNASLISYNSYFNSTLPQCVSVSNTGSQIVVTINNLNSCTNTGSMSINLNFSFLCPENCPSIPKTALFTGTLKDNFNTIQNGTCTANGILNNNFSMFQTFSSFNQATAEITFHVLYNNPNCFRIKNPKFTVTITPTSLGATILPTIIADRPSGINYSASGNTITPDVTEYNQQSQTGFYYVVKLPCNTGLGQTLTTNISLIGESCGVPNSLIFGPTPATYTIPASVAPTPNILINYSSSSSGFSYVITNTGNTPLNLTASNNLPLVHIKNSPSVVQGSNQAGLNGSVVYYNCSNTASTNYPLLGAGSANSNAPFNTKSINHIINGLQPGNNVSLTINYDLTSSCSGSAGAPPFIDNLVVTYNCNVPVNSCLNCGTSPGGSQSVDIVYNPHSIINCIGDYENIPGCKGIDDVFNLCYEFKNIGDAALNNGTLDIQLPPWLKINTTSITYNGFSSNPTIIPTSAIKFNLPNLPIGTGTYKICFDVKVLNGAIAGGNSIHSYINNSQSDLCVKSFLVCSYGSIGIEKKVKGNLDISFSSNGNGNPNSLVDYEITLHNTGTIPLNNLEVIDRIPAIGNLTILGNPNSTPINNQFNMQAIALPSNPDYSVSYSSIQNITTSWAGTGLPINTGTWVSSPLNGAIKFLYTPSITLAPGANKVITFQLQIPPNVSTDMIDCNTAGFIAKSTVAGYNINPTESSPACLTISLPPPPPCNCSNEDRFTSQPFAMAQGVRGARPDSTTCGGTIQNKLKCNTPYVFSIRYAMQGIVQGQCNGTDSIVVKDNSNSVINIATNNITSTVGISSINIPSFTQNGVYTVTFYLKKNGVVCSQCTMDVEVKCNDIPCTSCKETLIQASLATTQTNGTTNAGIISFKTGVTVQQVTMSIADIKYKWNKEGCQGDCKIPTSKRACILPDSNSRKVGTLQWSDFTTTNVRAAAANKCLEELKWNNDNSAALVAGSYNIPFNINLPSPLIDGCCKLEVEKLCIRLRFKDINCNVCDTVICLTDGQISKDCCFGGNWLNKSLDWNTSVPQTNTQFKINNTASASSASNKQGSIKVECGTTIQTSVGTVYTLSADYSCNTGIQECSKTVTRKVKTPSGISFGTWNYAKSFTFTEVGMHTVTYYAYCDAAQQIPCDSCVFYVNVEKNCCPKTITSTGNDSIFVPNFRGINSKQILTSPLSNPTGTLKTYSSCNDITIKLSTYNCPTGCASSFEWTRSRKNNAGQYIQLAGSLGTGTGNSTLVFGATPVDALDRITIFVKCGEKRCNSIQIFDLKNCLEIKTQGPNIDLGNLHLDELPACTNCDNNNNLVVNGDFEAGNSGFISQLVYNPSTWDLPNFNVATNTYPFMNSLLGNGKYLIVHSYYNHTGQLYGKTVWKTINTIPVTQNKSYNFCFNMLTAWPVTQPSIPTMWAGDPNLRVDVLINNQLILHNARVGTLNVINNTADTYNNTNWQQFNLAWSANASTSATIEIRFVDMALIPIGFGVKPDYPIVSGFTFGLDDIVFKECK